MSMLTAETLLAGSSLEHEITVPADLLGSEIEADRLKLRPLTVRDLQRIRKAAGEDESLSATLMIQHALVEPKLDAARAAQLPAGLARFLIEKINEISGIDTPRDALQELVQQPLARACFILAKEFGWTPEQTSALTIGQILLYLEMAREGGSSP